MRGLGVLGFRVEGSGCLVFRVEGFRVLGLGPLSCRKTGVGLSVRLQFTGCKVWGLGFRVKVLGCRN